jgi:hypothetical protein
MKLTEEEKQLILEKRRKENELNFKKTGILKHDVYGLPTNGYSQFAFDLRDIIEEHGLFVPKEVVLGIVEQIKDELLSTEWLIPSGTKFESYMIDGKELWYDQNEDVCDMDSTWASKNLKNIKKLKK